MSAVDTLKNLAIMLDWTLEERLMLAAKMVEVEVAEGDVLLTENQPAEAAYILKQGRLKITNRGEIVGQVDTVACFGEISCLLPDTPVSATVLAAAPSVVYRISRHDMVDAAQRMPKLWRSLFMQISERLKRVNKRLVEVLAHSPQGFLKLDRDALITNEYSTKCVQYLGREPLAGQSLPEILNAGRPSDVASWQSVFSMVFDDVGVPLSDLFDLLTPEARIEAFGELRDLRLAFHPIYEVDGSVSAVDVGIEDITRQRELEREEEVRHGRQATLGKVYQNPDAFFSLLRLIDDVESRAAALREGLAGGALASLRSDSDELMRQLHSLKGFSGVFGLSAVQRACHEFETGLHELAAGNAPVLPALLDGLRAACSEARVVREMIDPSLMQRLEGVVLLPQALDDLKSALVAGDVVRAAAIVEAAESIDARQLFTCWPVQADRIALQLGKSVGVDVLGGGGPISKTLFMALDRVLVHALNNAIDHGIEDPETRICAEKPEQGQISVLVETSPDSLRLEISDDGRGVDLEAAVSKARQKPGFDASLIDRYVADGEPWRVLLMPGFSAARAVSGISGRGVGLDALNSMVSRLGGLIEIDTTPGSGLTVRLEVPRSARLPDAV